MAYLKVNNVDFSPYTSGLQIDNSVNYISQTNASGDMVVDKLKQKKSITATIIPVDINVMKTLQAEIEKFSVTVSFLSPTTGQLMTANCIIPDNSVSYYTIQTDNVLTQAVTLTFTEL